MSLFDLLDDKIVEPDKLTRRYLEFLKRFKEHLVDLHNAGTNGCEDSCLVHTGHINRTAEGARIHNGGYPIVRVPWRSSPKNNSGAHRVYYFLTHREIFAGSSGYELGHYCIGDDGFVGTRKICVRHVRPMTASENQQGGMAAQKKERREAMEHLQEQVFWSLPEEMIDAADKSWL